MDPVECSVLLLVSIGNRNESIKNSPYCAITCFEQVGSCCPTTALAKFMFSPCEKLMIFKSVFNTREYAVSCSFGCGSRTWYPNHSKSNAAHFESFYKNRRGRPKTARGGPWSTTLTQNFERPFRANFQLVERASRNHSSQIGAYSSDSRLKHV